MPIFASESPESKAAQTSWFSQMWQAARDKAAGFATGVRETASSAQQKVSSYLPDVKSWSWTKTIAVLTAIAATFGVAIKIYNNNGDLVQTVGESSVSPSSSVTDADMESISNFTEAVGNRIGAIAVPIVLSNAVESMGILPKTVEQESAQLILDMNALSSNPKICLEALLLKIEEAKKTGSSLNLVRNRIMQQAYEKARKHFDDAIENQKYQLLNYVREKALGDFEEQIKLLSDPSTFKQLNRVQGDYSEGIKRAKELLEKNKIIADGQSNSEFKKINTWLNENYYHSDIDRKIEVLKKIKREKINYADFPVDATSDFGLFYIGEAINKLNDFKKTLKASGHSDEIESRKNQYLDYVRKEAPGNIEKQIELLSSKPSQHEKEKDSVPIMLAKEALEAEKNIARFAYVKQDDDAITGRLRIWVEENSNDFENPIGEQIQMLQDVLARKRELPEHLSIDVDTEEGRNVVEKVIDEKSLQ